MGVTCSTCGAAMVPYPKALSALDQCWYCPVDRRHGDRMWPDAENRKPEVSQSHVPLYPGAAHHAQTIAILVAKGYLASPNPLTEAIYWPALLAALSAAPPAPPVDPSP